MVLLQFGRNVPNVRTPAQIADEIDDDNTNLQVTASSSIPGAVSNLDNPDIADLLAIAIERGAISQEKNGTNVTLSTTPYMLLRAFAETFLSFDSRWSRASRSTTRGAHAAPLRSRQR